MIEILGVVFIIVLMLSLFVAIAALFSLVIDWDSCSSLGKCVHFIILAIAVFVFLGNIIGYGSFEKEEIVYEEIVSIEQNDEISGAFVLGTGRVDEETEYYMYAKTDKGLVLYKLAAGESTYIVESDEVVPHVSFVKEKWTEPYYIIYVPIGTITKEYKM